MLEVDLRVEALNFMNENPVEGVWERNADNFKVQVV